LTLSMVRSDSGPPETIVTEIASFAATFDDSVPRELGFIHLSMLGFIPTGIALRNRPSPPPPAGAFGLMSSSGLTAWISGKKRHGRKDWIDKPGTGSQHEIDAAEDDLPVRKLPE